MLSVSRSLSEETFDTETNTTNRRSSRIRQVLERKTRRLDVGGDRREACKQIINKRRTQQPKSRKRRYTRPGPVVPEDNQYAVKRIIDKRVQFLVQEKSGHHMWKVTVPDYLSLADTVKLIEVIPEYRLLWKGWGPRWAQWVEGKHISRDSIDEYLDEKTI